jgi:hypothetical protein
MRRMLALMCGLAAAGVAAGVTEPITYRSEATLGFNDVEDDFQSLFGYKFHFEPIDNDDKPVFLQPFLQRGSNARIEFTDGPHDRSLLDVETRIVFPNTPVGLDLGFGFGDATPTFDQSFFMIGGIVYFNSENTFAAEVSVDFKEISNVDVTQFQIGLRGIPGGGNKHVELALAYKSLDEEGGRDESGVIGDVLFYAGKRTFFGVRFDSVEPIERFVGTFGYSFRERLDVEFEVGSESDDFLFTSTLLFRF